MESLQKVRWANYPKLGRDRWDVKQTYVYGFAMPNPESFVDITDVLDLKRKAVMCFKSQNYWKMEETFLATPRRLGIMSGMGDYVEGFKTIRGMLL